MKYKKKYGQNFLNKKGISLFIARCQLDRDDTVFEIGAGDGRITREIAKSVKKVYAIEIDKNLRNQILANLLGHDVKVITDFQQDDSPPFMGGARGGFHRSNTLTQPLSSRERSVKGNVEIIFEDFRKFDLSFLIDRGVSKIIGNLPFNSSKFVIRRLLEQRTRSKEQRTNFHEMVFIIQKEVAQSLASKKSSIFSLTTQYLSQKIEVCDIIPKDWFTPAPQVDGQIVKMIPQGKVSYSKGTESFDIQQFFRFIKICFASRRKTLVNNLLSFQLHSGNYLKKKEIFSILSKNTIPLHSRAEDLLLSDFLRLFKIFSKF